MGRRVAVALVALGAVGGLTGAGCTRGPDAGDAVATTVPRTSLPGTSIPGTSIPVTVTSTVPATLPPPCTLGPTTTTVPPPPTTTAPATAASTTTAAPAASAVALWQGTSGRHEIALTFDAGSDTGNAAAILDLLADRGIRASFGMTGDWAAANPALVQRMVDEGHVLINHTQDHPYLTQLSRADRLAELAAADAAVSAITGRTMQPFFRPPYGDQDDSVLADVARAGYRWSVMWTVDSLGWKGLGPDAVADRVLAAAADGAIVLMHVGSQSTDVAALPAIIDGFSAEGYAFVTVAQLVA